MPGFVSDYQIKKKARCSCSYYCHLSLLYVLKESRF